MTAVEWLAEMVFNEEDLQDFVLVNVINQAKEMEKEQIMNAWDDGQSDGATICTQKADNPSEEYYNKTFKSK